MAELIEKEFVYQIMGCSMAVHKELGPGLREKTYERALCVEFRHQKILHSQQSNYTVKYRGEQIDEFIPDLIADNRVIVDVKAVREITDLERSQMHCYLRITGLKVGLIINFANPKLEWERRVLDTAR